MNDNAFVNENSDSLQKAAQRSLVVYDNRPSCIEFILLTEWLLLQLFGQFEFECAIWIHQMIKHGIT